MSGQRSKRNKVLGEVGHVLQGFAVERFTTHGPHDQRGAAFWDAAVYVVEQMGDGGLAQRPVPASPEGTGE